MQSLQKSERNGQIQGIQGKGLANLPAKFTELCGIVYQVNQLRQFPLTDIEIAEWSKTILEFKPELDYEELRFIIREMKFGNLDFDQKEGVQNLTRAFKKIEKINGQLRLLRQNIF